MPKTVTLSDERLVEAARIEATAQGRSLGQQITHWARIGRAIERSGHYDFSKIAKALAAEIETNTLNVSERAVWTELFLEKLSEPGPDETAYFAKLRESLTAIGVDGINVTNDRDREPD